VKNLAVGFLNKSKLKWNFAMGLIHGTFFRGGQAFGNPDTILPVFLNNFTNSKILIGFSSTIMGSLGGIGSVLPQLFVASRLENKVHKRPVLRVTITIRALCWGSFVLDDLSLCRFPSNFDGFFFIFSPFRIHFYGRDSCNTIHGHLG